MSQIELSVAMIFKNEIRCLERCLKSLQPLRERFSMELVMADTGSDDGSRNLAEQYADILFDFPWVNDFAAARNAVLDRCSGTWALSIDCDEWLDASAPAALEEILRGDAAQRRDGAWVTVRNYTSRDNDQSYSDFPIIRLARLASGIRFSGRIHEALCLDDRDITAVRSALLLHHDGYIMLNDDSEAGREKRRRNMELLRAEVAEAPEDLVRWVQIADSCGTEPDCMELMARAARLAEERKPGWQVCGAPILRRAAQYACRRHLPETLAWVDKARSLFPDSYYTRIDVRRYEMIYYYQKEEYAACVAPAEAYLRGCAALRREKRTPAELGVAILTGAAPDLEESTRVLLADIHRLLGHSAKALAHYKKMDWSVPAPEELSWMLEDLSRLRQRTDAGLDGVLRSIWRAVRPAEGETDRRAACRKEFLRFAGAAFAAPEPQGEERPLWRVFLPLRGECAPGDWAALLDAQTPEEADAALAAVEDLEALPPAVFLHALQSGADFPIPGRNLTEAQFDALAEKLAADRTFLLELARFAADAAETVPELLWARSLARAALKQR